MPRTFYSERSISRAEVRVSPYYRDIREAEESGTDAGPRRTLDVLADLGVPAPDVAAVLCVDVAAVRQWHEADRMPAALLQVLLDLGAEQVRICEAREHLRLELADCDCNACMSAWLGEPYESLAEAVGVAAGVNVERLRAEAAQ